MTIVRKKQKSSSGKRRKVSTVEKVMRKVGLKVGDKLPVADIEKIQSVNYPVLNFLSEEDREKIITANNNLIMMDREMALEISALRDSNRDIIPSNYKLLIQKMLTNEFTYMPSPIVFTQHGLQAGGNHRVQAFLEVTKFFPDYKIPITIATIEEKDYPFQDEGEKFSLKHFLQRAGNNKKASILKSIVENEHSYNDYILGNISKGDDKTSVRAMALEFKKNEKEIFQAMEYAVSAEPDFKIKQGKTPTGKEAHKLSVPLKDIAFAYYMFNKIDRVLCQEFFKLYREYTIGMSLLARKSSTEDWHPLEYVVKETADRFFAAGPGRSSGMYYKNERINIIFRAWNLMANSKTIIDNSDFENLPSTVHYEKLNIVE